MVPASEQHTRACTPHSRFATPQQSWETRSAHVLTSLCYKQHTAHTPIPARCPPATQPALFVSETVFPTEETVNCSLHTRMIYSSITYTRRLIECVGRIGPVDVLPDGRRPSRKACCPNPWVRVPDSVRAENPGWVVSTHTLTVDERRLQFLSLSLPHWDGLSPGTVS